MKDDTSLIIGSRIKSAREKSGKTQKDVALMLGYKTPSIISEFESGKKDVTAHDLFKIAIFLGTSVNYVFGVEEPVQSKIKSIALEELQLIEEFREAEETDKAVVIQLLGRKKKNNLLSFSS